MLHDLVTSLKDYTTCNDDLAIQIRKAILEPFQLDLSQPESVRKPPPTPTDFKNMSVTLAPYAMKIINQNLKLLAGIKRANLPSIVYTKATNCLIDTSFYALAALRHMSAYTKLESIDIEKSTSNLICKMVDLKEYDRSLDEIVKLRSKLASYAKVQLKKNTLPESIPGTKTLWEAEMVKKYQDLFQFPLDPQISDKDIILLVLSYQMNVFRCWCELREGILSKYLPYLLERPGNFFDWCLHLFKFNDITAQQQLITLQRLLYGVANKLPQTEDAAIHSYNIQILALKALKLSQPASLKLILDRMVRIGITYEKSSKQTSYSHIQQCCDEFLTDLKPHLEDLDEMDSYFVVCEYYAYISKKAKSYKGAFFAYKFMIGSLRSVLEDPKEHAYYYTAYAANAKLSLGTVQMDKVVLDDTFADISRTFMESASLLKILATILQEPITVDEHSSRAIYNLCKGIEAFKQSAKRLYDYISEKTSKELAEDDGDVFKTPPRQGELITPSSFGQWDSIMAHLNSALDQCCEILPAHLPLMKNQPKFKYVAQPADVMMTFVDTMILLARVKFNINDHDTFERAYEYLSTAEEMCMQNKFAAGYRWLSGSYFNLGMSLIKVESYSLAQFPIRKSCTLLEKDPARANTEEGRIQLCKRYEILGVCSQKNRHFEDAIKSYRLALKRIPASLVEKFVCKADSMAVSTIMEKETLIPKLIDRFLTASVIDPDQSQVQFASEFINMSTIQPIQKCIIYECELKIWSILGLKMSLSKFQMFIIEKLLQVYDAKEFPIRRSRVILNRLRIERTANKRSRSDGLKKAIESANEMLEILKTKDYQNDINLLNYRIHYIASANSWIAICGRELKKETPNTFMTTLQQWGSLLKNIVPIYNTSGSTKEEIEQVYNCIDDVDQLYDHMRMLADLFSVTGEYVYQICALRILLKLNNGLRNAEEDCVSDSIMLTSAIGRVYCDLGYTGKASTEFNQAKLMVAHKPCSNFSELVYHTNYAYYLASINDYDSSRDAFDSAKLVWKYKTEEDDDKKSVTTVKTYTKRCTLLADAYFALSKIQANTETLNVAIESATNAVQLLNKCIKIFQTAHQEKQANNDVNDPYLPSPPPEPTKVVFRESQWEIAHKLSQCLQYLAYLCMQKGSWNEAIYFVKQGPLLAEKVNSPFMVFNSALCASEYYLRCGDMSKSQDYLERATDSKSKGSYHQLDEAKLKSLMADLALTNKCFDIALKTYEDANRILEKIYRPEYISNLEALIHGNDAYDSIGDSQHEPFDCVPLRQLSSKNTIQKAKAIAQIGDKELALETLEKLEESEFDIEHIIELNALISQWKLSAVQKQLANHNGEVSVLPSMKLQMARRTITNRQTSTRNLRGLQDELSSVVECALEAYRIGFNKERLSVIQDFCNQLSVSMFLEEKINATQSRHLTNNNALLSSYYMSMANSINMRREIQSCLKIKMNRYHPSHIPSDNAWPATDEDEKLERYARLARMNRNPKWLQAHLETLSELYRIEHDLDDKQFQEKFIDILPEHWTVCSISVDPIHQDIYAMQLRKNEAPFVAKLPINRAHQRSQQYPSAISFGEAEAELKDIINRSDETIYASKDCVNPQQVSSWWSTRTELDNRLKKLLENMENQWFSGFKGLMAGRYHEYKEELIKFQKGLSDAVYKFVNQINGAKRVVEFSLNFCRLSFKLGRNPNTQDLQDLAYYTLTCYENQGIEFDYSKIDIQQLTNQIRVLINRYHDKSSMAGVPSTKTIPNEHVILILDKHIQVFPAESMPLLRTQSVSRLPSLSFLRDRILYAQSYNTRAAFDDFGVVSTREWKELTISKKSAFYVLNPNGDLKDTQKEFETIFKSVPEWDGVTSTMPMEFQCTQALQTKDIYMYFGHSAGQAFMRGTTVRQLPVCAVSLLMGCSSGILNTNGEFDPYGYVLNFLLAGSPAVVANLWDVTDRSIDQLTKCMLSSWGLLKNKPNSKSLVQAVTESRNGCHLSYLIGAAPVVYGIPVYLQQNGNI